jgi:hypothetical protein
LSGKDRSVNKIIKKAIEDGKFDDLAGKGEPLELKKNPYVKDGWNLAFDMLSSQGLSLPWIDKRNMIEDSYIKAHEIMSRTRKWYLQKTEEKEDQKIVEDEWGKAKSKFIETVKELNLLIDSYNLEIPNDHFYRKRIDHEYELSNI